MLSLGIESTAHTFGIGIVDDKGNVLANEKYVYQPPLGYGIIPIDAANKLRENAESVLEKALEKAKIRIDEVDVISFSRGPGLPPCLRVGKDFVNKILERLEKDVKIYGVNHCVAHVEIGILKTDLKDPVTLYVSGGNTQILAFVEKRYRCFGETLDIAIGNMLDSFAREANLQHPGGPKIEELAKKGSYIELPYVVKGMDFSFTGILTAAIRKLKEGIRLEDLCYSIQETCFAMLTEATERALAHTGKEEVLLTGGVAANKRLQEMLRIMCEERGASFAVVPSEYAGDNGAMIAWLGILMRKADYKPLKLEEIDILPKWRTEDFEVMWK
ncbi:MAG: bifunctional N(6)-L-threonylcarbamoyladenine synthase/serine/threonine protein kinase [Candidatus Aenigmatarchaeota archaeon]